MVYSLFDKKSAAMRVNKFVSHTGTGINSNLNFENQQWANELYKPIIRKFKKMLTQNILTL